MLFFTLFVVDRQDYSELTENCSLDQAIKEQIGFRESRSHWDSNAEGFAWDSNILTTTMPLSLKGVCFMIILVQCDCIVIVLVQVVTAAVSTHSCKSITSSICGEYREKQTWYIYQVRHTDLVRSVLLTSDSTFSPHTSRLLFDSSPWSSSARAFK